MTGDSPAREPTGPVILAVGRNAHPTEVRCRVVYGNRHAPLGMVPTSFTVRSSRDASVVAGMTVQVLNQDRSRLDTLAGGCPDGHGRKGDASMSSTTPDTGKSLQASRVIAAPAQAIFDMLANPHRHSQLDGVGIVRGPDPDTAPVSELGEVFAMNMHNPRGDYRTLNTVTAYEPVSSIGWSPRLDPDCALATKIGDMVTGGHTFTYHLRETGDGTEVTQVYDWSTVKDPRFAATCPAVNQEQLAATLDNLAQAVDQVSHRIGD